MGTETLVGGFLFQVRPRRVKLNNPLMGMETLYLIRKY